VTAFSLKASTSFSITYAPILLLMDDILGAF